MLPKKFRVALPGHFQSLGLRGVSHIFFLALEQCHDQNLLPAHLDQIN